jgi:hypothetical protein
VPRSWVCPKKGRVNRSLAQVLYFQCCPLPSIHCSYGPTSRPRGQGLPAAALSCLVIYLPGAFASLSVRRLASLYPSGCFTAGAEATAKLLQSRGVQLELVLDEGGIITRDGISAGPFRVVDKPMAVVGTAEKVGRWERRAWPGVWVI